MHITGKEKTLAAKPILEGLAVDGAVSDGGESEVAGDRCPFQLAC
jgi:hypothetical protein